MVDSAYFVKPTPLRAFTRFFNSTDLLQTYWSCASRSLMQKKYFLTNLQGVLLSHFSMAAANNWWLIVYTLWNQLLLELSLDLFNTLKICCKHIEDVHEEVWYRKNIFWQTYRVVNLAIFSTLWTYVADQGYKNFEIRIGPLDQWHHRCHRNLRLTIPSSHEN